MSTTANAPTTPDGPSTASPRPATEGGPTGSRRRSIDLREAATEFWRWPTPWIITAVLVPAAVARVVVGGVTAADLVLVAALLAVQPFLEWVVHIAMLHMRPKQVLGRTLDPLFARKHREHHADPRRTELVFIPVPVLLQTLVLVVLVGWFAFPRVELGLTFVVTMAGIGAAYEWVHYLIHSDYRPQRGFYRMLWRNHRLHHFKNENYWFTVTNPTADKVLRTDPDPSEVETSPTARDLLGTGA